MKSKVFLTLFLLLPFVALSQQSKFSGVVKDAETGETLIGANVLIKEGVGTISDFQGKFSIMVPRGEYDVKISFVGYQTVTRHIDANGQKIYHEIKLEPKVLDEVLIVADVARARETPIAFTNVLPAKIEEELAGQEMPMILNSTPGVYATEQGAGGEPRVTIRGFSQRNVAVMLDGIPVNDMENGRVYWSNWFGLDAVTRTIQVQRGLGASKLAIPSVGGTMNIITKGIENERQFKIKQELNSTLETQTTLGFTSGKLKNDWGVTLAASYERGDGLIDHTDGKAWFYYAKVDKRIGNHIINFMTMGAPQYHHQRNYKKSIAKYDTTFAKDLDVPSDKFPPINNMGIYYNPHWGYIKRDRFDTNAEKKVLNERTNHYYKPMFSLRDFWQVNENVSISNVAYLSIGRGGGIRTKESLNNSSLEQNPDSADYGQIKWQKIYDANAGKGLFPPINPTYSDSLYASGNYLRDLNNNHFWYGLLSTVNYSLNDRIKISGGIDLRSYQGEHYSEVHDLLGGDYAISKEDQRISQEQYQNNPELAMKYEGDKDFYWDIGYVNWAGAFGQIEYKNTKFSTFLNLSGATVGHKNKDFFKDGESDWKYFPSFTVKGGANYNITDHQNIFANLGYLSKVRNSSYIFEQYSYIFRENIKNEFVKAIEGGYSTSYNKFASNLNAYYTRWENKPTYPLRSQIDGENVTGQIPGMDALHMGIEFDFIYQISPSLDVQGLVSYGDWRWKSEVEDVKMYDSNQEFVGTMDFDATDVHVSDAAQTQIAGSIRWEPVKKWYLNAKITHFARHYANMDPESLAPPHGIDENGNPKDSWLTPSYELVDFHTGYSFSVKNFRFHLRASVLNVLDQLYISDAQNNDDYIYYSSEDFDAKSASVFFGFGRRFNTSLTITF